KEGKKVKEGKDGETASVRSDSGPRRGKEKKYGNAYQNIVKPLVTEKASALGVEDKYIFQVAPKANKIEIAKSIEEIYGIKPVSVNIINLRGKNVRYGRTIGRRKSWKKAIIKLPKGKTIKIYEGV
ncbi:MAG: 50S ribosomal protein L23, partial [Patescibacteria group bacterium]